MRRVFLQQPGARPRGLQLQQLHKSTTRSIVMGCGSNVVDEFYPLRRFPKARIDRLG